MYPSSQPGFGSSVAFSETRTNPFNNDSSTTDTIGIMRSLARAEAYSPLVQGIVTSCERQAGPRDIDMIRCLYQWVRCNVKFGLDEEILSQYLGIDREDKELLLPPSVLLSMASPTGDCDDFSLLMAALLTGCGYTNWFVTIACDYEFPSRWSHVFNKSVIPDEGKFIYLDTSHGNYAGWAKSDGVFRKKEWLI